MLELQSDVIKQKLGRFAANPSDVIAARVGAVTTRIFDVLRQVLWRARFVPAFYYPWRHWVNRRARALYISSKASMALNPVQQQIARELETDGISVVRFEDLFPGKDLQEFARRAEDFLQQASNQSAIRSIEEGRHTVRRWKFYLVHLFGIRPVLDHGNPFLALSLSNAVLNPVCAYLRSFCRITDVDLWCNIASSEPEVYSQKWHRDPDDIALVKMFLYLNDVDKDRGPFQYVPGSQNGGALDSLYRQKLHESQYPPDGEIERHLPGERVKVCTGKSGTLIFCNTTGLHRGGNPKSGSRLVYTTSFMTNAGLLHNPSRFSVRGRAKDLAPAGAYAIALAQRDSALTQSADR